MKNIRRPRRWPLRRVARFVAIYFRQRRRAIRADAHALGIDSLKAGLAALIVNAFLENTALLRAAVVTIVIGLALWLVGLPRDRKGP